MCSHVHIAKKQRGSVYNHENVDNGSVSVHVDNMTIYNMFESLSKQVENLYTNFNKRISSIEENLELKLTQKLKNAVDNTVRSEVSVVAQEVKDHVADFEMEMRNKVTDVEKKFQMRTEDLRKVVESEVTREVHAKIRTYSDAVESSPKDRTRNVIIRNMPETERERTEPNVTLNRVKSLLRDRLKLHNVNVMSAERKQARGKQKHGIVVVQLESTEQKRDVMKVKGKLKMMTQYKDLFIEDDLSPEQRVGQQNMRLLVKELGQERNYKVVRGKLVRNQPRSRGNSPNGKGHGTSGGDRERGDQRAHRGGHQDDHDGRYQDNSVTRNKGRGGYRDNRARDDSRNWGHDSRNIREGRGPRNNYTKDRDFRDRADTQCSDRGRAQR